MKRQYPPNEGQQRGQAPTAPESADAPADGGDALQLDAEDIAADLETEALRGEIASLNDKILRLAAELENTRRRAEREKLDAGRYAIAGFARDLLNVIDAFERALALSPADRAAADIDGLWAILEGIKLSEANMLVVLDRHGVKRIHPKGEKFDPNLHQAVAQAPGGQPAGHVEEVAQPGFVIGERVLRAAMVIVSTGPAAKPQDAPDGEDAAGVRFDTTV